MDLFRQKVESDFQSLRKTLDTLNDSVSNLSVCLQEHKEQTTVQLTNLQTSVNSTYFSLANQTGQLNNKLDSHSNHSSQLNNKLHSLSSKLNTIDTSLSQHQQQTTAELTHLQTSHNSTKFSLANQNGQLNKLDGLSTELCSKLDTLNSTQSSNAMQLDNKLDEMSSKVNALHSVITEHQQQTTAELSHLQTSLNSKLDSLMATAAQLSSDHQEIQTNISDVQCMDTQQSLQLHQNLHNNLTHQLKKIKNDATFIRNEHICGGTEGWRRVVHLDMTDSHTTCPSGWNMTGYSIRTCGRNSTLSRTCSSATFPVSGGEYNRICGRIKAYQWGATVAFYNYHSRPVTTIDGAYACGVSVTHGTPRNHIWTFVAGLSEGSPPYTEVCPCDATRTIRIPPFVGNDYFCESGINEPWDGISRHYTLHSNDTLWDGEDCLPSSTCCSQHNPPYFTKQLPTPTTDDIEARICLINPLQYANVAVELVELYVQ